MLPQSNAMHSQEYLFDQKSPALHRSSEIDAGGTIAVHRKTILQRSRPAHIQPPLCPRTCPPSSQPQVHHQDNQLLQQRIEYIVIDPPTTPLK